jgi:6-phosphogluconolactonase
MEITLMKIEVFADADAVAREAATLIAADARAAVAQRGRFIMAVSGGHTPWVMLRALAGEEVPWDKVHMTQVDERVAPAGHPDRNLTHLRESLLEHAPLPPEQIYAMPVEALDLLAAAKQYAANWRRSPVRRRCSILSTWGSVPMGTLLHWCQETRSWRLVTGMLV